MGKDVCTMLALTPLYSLKYTISLKVFLDWRVYLIVLLPVLSILLLVVYTGRLVYLLNAVITNINNNVTVIVELKELLLKE